MRAVGGRRTVLLAGESWISSTTHFKGWDHFGSATYDFGAGHLVAALAESAFTLTYLPSHLAARDFPQRLEDLQAYDAIMLSDIGANTLLLHPDTWLAGKPSPNRLKLLREYVRGDGGLAMIGGYLSFQGLNGAARYRGTPVEAVLPVTLLPYDDRVEMPEGFRAECTGPAGHPILAGLDGEWPLLLGYNEVGVKEDGVAETTVLTRAPADASGHPLLVTGKYGSGRTLAWMSDLGPHWLPDDFAAWPGYARLWQQALAWLTGLAD